MTFSGYVPPAGPVESSLLARSIRDLYANHDGGTFDPIFSAATPPTGVTYVARAGKYTKIADVVTVYSAILLSSKGTGGAGAIQLGGLPFTVTDVSPPLLTGFSLVDLSAGYTYAFCVAIAGQTYAQMFEVGDNNAEQAINWSAISDTSILFFTGNYWTS